MKKSEAQNKGEEKHVTHFNLVHGNILWAGRCSLHRLNAASVTFHLQRGSCCYGRLLVPLSFSASLCRQPAIKKRKDICRVQSRYSKRQVPPPPFPSISLSLSPSVCTQYSKQAISAEIKSMERQAVPKRTRAETRHLQRMRVGYLLESSGTNRESGLS